MGVPSHQQGELRMQRKLRLLKAAEVTQKKAAQHASDVAGRLRIVQQEAVCQSSCTPCSLSA